VKKVLSGRRERSRDHSLAVSATLSSRLLKMGSIQDSQGQDAFLSHLITVLSIYELGLFPASFPTYDGPSNWQTESVLRSLSALTCRIHLAEDVPPEDLNIINAPSKDRVGEDRSGVSDTQAVSSLSQSSASSASFSYPGNENPMSFTKNGTVGTTLGVLPITDGMRGDGKSDDDRTMSTSHKSTVVASQMTSFSAPSISRADHIVCPTCGNTIIDTIAQINTPPNFAVSPSYLPLIVPPTPLSTEPTEPALPTLEELRLLKSQLGDVARVCNAVARGDLSHKITVPVHGTVMVQLKDVINTMVCITSSFNSIYLTTSQVDNLGQFAREMEMVCTDQEIGMQRLRSFHFFHCVAD
jgi:osomolarity two-component system, sensor histidine kinase NIK1